MKSISSHDLGANMSAKEPGIVGADIEASPIVASRLTIARSSITSTISLTDQALFETSLLTFI